MKNNIAKWVLGIAFTIAFFFSFWAFWDMRAHTEFNAAIMGLDILRLLIILCHIGLAALSKKATSWIPMIFTVFLGVICAFTKDKQGINDQYVDGFTSPILYLTHYGWTFQAINISFLFIETCGALYARAYIEGRGVLEILTAKYKAICTQFVEIQKVVEIDTQPFEAVLAENNTLLNHAQSLGKRAQSVKDHAQTLHSHVHSLYKENESLLKDVQTLRTNAQAQQSSVQDVSKDEQEHEKVVQGLRKVEQELRKNVQDMNKSVQEKDSLVQRLSKQVQDLRTFEQRWTNLAQVQESDCQKATSILFNKFRSAKAAYETKDKSDTQMTHIEYVRGLFQNTYFDKQTINQILK